MLDVENKQIHTSSVTVGLYYFQNSTSQKRKRKKKKLSGHNYFIIKTHFTQLFIEMSSTLKSGYIVKLDVNFKDDRFHSKMTKTLIYLVTLTV